MRAFQYSFFLMVLATTAMAMGGKKQENPALPTGLVNSLGANVAAQAVDPVLAFANWCQARLGRLTTDQLQCVTQLSYRFGQNVHKDTWSSDVRVAPNDTLNVTMSGSPKILIGLNETIPEQNTFVAEHEGILAFSAPAKGKKFSVSQVQVRRCFEPSGKTAVCSSLETTAEDNSRKPNENKRRKRPASASAPSISS